MKPKIIAVVPARTGSKRLPKKNQLNIEDDKSLLQNAIDCAKDCGLVDEVFIYSDSPYLNHVRAKFILEPSYLAGDDIDISAAVHHATEEAEKLIGPVDYVVTLQPAVLARSPLIVRRMIEGVICTDAQGAVTAARTVPWQWEVGGPGNCFDEAFNSWSPGAYPRSNAVGIHLCEINAVQIGSRQVVRDKKRWDMPLLLAELPHWAAALDVDDAADLARARDMWHFAKYRLETWEPKLHVVNRVNQ